MPEPPEHPLDSPHGKRYKIPHADPHEHALTYRHCEPDKKESVTFCNVCNLFVTPSWHCDKCGYDECIYCNKRRSSAEGGSAGHALGQKRSRSD